MAEILGRFPVRSKAKDKDEEEESDEDATDETAEHRCEAQILTDILNRLDEQKLPKKEETESKESKHKGTPNPKGEEENPKPSNRGNAPEWEPLAEKPETPTAEVPPGCSLKVGMPTNASPFVQVFLPTGETHNGKGSHSRSFKADEKASSSSGFKGRATISQAAATAQVVAWAWEWWNKSTTSRAPKRAKQS